MRVGMSWPGQHGRRYWISLHPAVLLALAPLYVAAWTLAATIWLAIQLAATITQVIRDWLDERAKGQGAG